MTSIFNFLAPWSQQILSVFRIIVGLLFLEHGTSSASRSTIFAKHGSESHDAFWHQWLY